LLVHAITYFVFPPHFSNIPTIVLHKRAGVQNHGSKRNNKNRIPAAFTLEYPVLILT